MLRVKQPELILCVAASLLHHPLYMVYVQSLTRFVDDLAYSTQLQPLGASDLEVSNVCMGTMTFGEQTAEAEAHKMLSFATEAGINFIDTAEVRAAALHACGSHAAGHTQRVHVRGIVHVGKQCA